MMTSPKPRQIRAQRRRQLKEHRRAMKRRTPTGIDASVIAVTAPSSKTAKARITAAADAMAKRQARMYTATGLLHLAAPGVYAVVIPEVLPGTRRQWAVWSGVAELGVAGLLALPRTRRLGGAASAALLVGVWPANVKMAVDWRDRPWPLQAIAIARVPLQVPMIRSAVAIARG